MAKSISIIKLNEALQSKSPPVLFEVQKKPVFENSPKVRHNAKWQAYDEVTKWKEVYWFCIWRFRYLVKMGLLYGYRAWME